MIRAILDDLRTSYTWIGGGGISDIVEDGPGKYVVHLPQDEREDLMRYEMAVDDACGVRILSRKADVVSYR